MKSVLSWLFRWNDPPPGMCVLSMGNLLFSVVAQKLNESTIQNHHQHPYIPTYITLFAPSNFRDYLLMSTQGYGNFPAL